MTKRLLTQILAFAGLLLGLVWVLSTLATGFSAPAWVPAVGFCCSAAALVLLVT